MFKLTCSSLLFLLLALAVPFCFASTFPPGDLDYNAKVDFEDIALLAQQWLENGCQPASLRNHWKFDERTGNLAYDSSSDNTGISSGGKWTDGRIESGLAFDGDSVVDINDISLTSNWTISFWVYSTAPQDEPAVGSTIFGDDADQYNCFYIIDDNKARFINSGSDYITWTDDVDFYKKWRFVTLVGDVNSVELYLDSVSQGKQEIAPEINIAKIGTGHSDSERNFIGKIDDFRIYDEALGFEQIQLLNRTGTTVFNCGDIDDSALINMGDFAQLAGYWQKEFGPVVINEFMASNDNCIADEFGNYPDWIELYNPTNTAFDVGGMYLSDSGNIWQIPDNDPDKTTINPHCYLLIWADGSPELGTLHVDFKLSADGESAILYENDGSTIVDSISFGPQTTDVSFGRFPDLSDNWKLFSEPTPGKTNGVGYSGLSKPVNLSVKSKCFTEPFAVELSSQDENAIIYYTINGESPHQMSEKYTAPITINETTIIRAMAKNKDMAESDITSETYIELSPEVAGFNSNLPLFIIESFGDADVNSTANQEYIYNTSVFINTDENERAALTDPAEYFGRSGIRVRGSSTAGAQKRQYAFETWDEYNEDKNVSIFGLPSESDWVVQGPYSDKTLMRNYLVYKWSNDIGQYAPRVVYMEGFINTNGGPITMADYVGVYYFMEKIKRDKNRVAIEKLTPYDNDQPRVTGGYILKKDRLDPGDSGFSSQMGLLAFVEPKFEEITDAQKSYITGYIYDFQAALSAPDFDDPETGYAKYADANSFIDSQILVELAKNIDGYRLSTFMYKDRGGKLKMGPAWDYNLSLGNCSYNAGWNPVGWYYAYYDNFTAYSWYAAMFEDIEFHMSYIDRWFSLRRGRFSADTLMNEIDETAAYLDESQQRNFEKWQIIDKYNWPNPGWDHGDDDYPGDPPLTYPEHIGFMKDWLKGRVEWMDSQFIAPPIFNSNGGKVVSGFGLTMEVSDIPKITKFIDTNEPWKYLDDGSDQSTDWSVMNFNDSGWFEGNGPFGYGEDDENTIIYYGLDPNNKYITTYFRKTFEIIDPNRVHTLTLKLLYDDGAVVYLNNNVLPRFNIPDGRLTYLTLAASEIEGEDENNYFIYELDPSILNEGDNYIAVEIHQASADSNDMSFDLILEGITGRCMTLGKIYYTTDNTDPRLTGGAINPTAIEYTEPIAITENTLVKAREFDDANQWSAINKAALIATDVGNALRITEIMYHPGDTNNPDDPNTEFIELTNITESPINLNLVHFREGINFTFGNFYLNSEEYIVVVKDIDAFEAKYGSGINVAGQYIGSLDNSGERIRLTDALDDVILDFEYEDEWYPSTDGLGSSLVIRNAYNNDVNSWNEKESWMPSSDLHGNPGRKDSSDLPIPGAIVINELLSNPASGQCDWIELHNTTDEAIDIGEWFISDSDANFMKYEIAKPTIIPANGYVVFYESMHFGNAADPGCHKSFGLSSKGENVFLRSGKDGQLTGYYDSQEFGAAITATTFGRHVKSTGDCDFVAMSQITPAAENAYPKVGPIIFNQIMYHPQYSSDAEFILLYNVSGQPITLQAYDSESHTNVPWAFVDGIDFTFPLNTVMPVSGYLVIAKNPVVFNSIYGPTSRPVLGPFDGQLNNSGEKLELAMPTSDFDNDNERIYITMEHVEYGENDPWPEEADGQGYMLFKRPLRNYSNDPINWQALR